MAVSWMIMVILKEVRNVIHNSNPHCTKVCMAANHVISVLRTYLFFKAL